MGAAYYTRTKNQNYFRRQSSTTIAGIEEVAEQKDIEPETVANGHLHSPTNINSKLKKANGRLPCPEDEMEEEMDAVKKTNIFGWMSKDKSENDIHWNKNQEKILEKGTR